MVQVNVAGEIKPETKEPRTNGLEHGNNVVHVLTEHCPNVFLKALLSAIGITEEGLKLPVPIKTLARKLKLSKHNV